MTVDPELSLEEVDFFDAEISECPYSAYKVLREQAPVWEDPISGMYVITRYEDIKEILVDTERFRNARKFRARTNKRSEMIRELYKSKGWVPAPTLAGRDNPEHKEMKALFAHAFRPQKIKQLDPFVENLANRLLETFLNNGKCDWVKEFAIPLPLIVIGHQMGVPEKIYGKLRHGRMRGFSV